MCVCVILSVVFYIFVVCKCFYSTRVTNDPEDNCCTLMVCSFHENVSKGNVSLFANVGVTLGKVIKFQAVKRSFRFSFFPIKHGGRSPLTLRTTGGLNFELERCYINKIEIAIVLNGSDVYYDPKTTGYFC